MSPTTPNRATSAPPACHRLLRPLAVVALCLPLLGGLLLAQSASTGTVTGRVFDQRTGQSLEGAVVRVAGTTTLDYTTSDGRYSLTIPAGPVSIEVEYVGLDPVANRVDVIPGATTTLNAAMTSAVFKMDSFVVQESVRGQAQAINMQNNPACRTRTSSASAAGRRTSASAPPSAATGRTDTPPTPTSTGSMLTTPCILR